VTEGAGRGVGGDAKGSLTDKRKGTPSLAPMGSGGASAGSTSAGSTSAGSTSAGSTSAGSTSAGGASTGNGSYRPPQASSPGARAVAGATSSGVATSGVATSGVATSGVATSGNAAGSVLPPPVIEAGKGPSAGSPLASLELLAERYASLTDDAAFSADEAVDRQIAGLEAWCRAAIWRERRDLSRFWVLRSIAFMGVTVASAAPYLPGSSPALPLSAGTLAAIALAIDSAWPPAADRVSRHRAIRELRELQHTLRLKWDKVRLAHPERFSPKRIAHALSLLDAAQAKREEIGGYLNDSSPGV